MQNLNVFRCYTCKTQAPRYFVEDLAEQIMYNRCADLLDIERARI